MSFHQGKNFCLPGGTIIPLFHMLLWGFSRPSRVDLERCRDEAENPIMLVGILAVASSSRPGELNPALCTEQSFIFTEYQQLTAEYRGKPYMTME